MRGCGGPLNKALPLLVVLYFSLLGSSIVQVCLWGFACICIVVALMVGVPHHSASDLLHIVPPINLKIGTPTWLFNFISTPNH